jgi:hypothetical protein
MQVLLSLSGAMLIICCGCCVAYRRRWMAKRLRKQRSQATALRESLLESAWHFDHDQNRSSA